MCKALWDLPATHENRAKVLDLHLPPLPNITFLSIALSFLALYSALIIQVVVFAYKMNCMSMFQECTFSSSWEQSGAGISCIIEDGLEEG